MTASHAEQLRLAALHAYEVLDSTPAPDLDGVVALAAMLTGAPTAVINLVDADRLWSAAAVGRDRGDVPRDGAMCEWVALERSSLHIPDARADPQWAGSPHVDGRIAAVRMYAGAPIVDSAGHGLGSVCVLDDEPRRLSPDQLGALTILADQVVELLAGRQRRLALAAAVQELDRLAHVDGLTGLLNRAAATRALERMCEHGGSGALFIDVDGFKAVNDATGHDGGDRVLREIAARLREGLRPMDLLARWAGDEFLVLVAGPVDDADVRLVTERLHEHVAKPYVMDGRSLELSVSIGGTVVEAGCDPGAALRAADRAMYVSKRNARLSSQARRPRPAGRW